MDSKDIEAQLKSLIGLNLSQNATGTLPISKGKVLNFNLHLVLYINQLQTLAPAEHPALIPTGEAGAGPGAQVRLIASQTRETRSPVWPRRKGTRAS